MPVKQTLASQSCPRLPGSHARAGDQAKADGLGERNYTGRGNVVVGCSGRADCRPGAVAASRWFAVPGAPPPPLPSPQTQRRARFNDHVIARSPHPYRFRPAFTANVLPSPEPIFCVDRFYNITVNSRHDTKQIKARICSRWSVFLRH